MGLQRINQDKIRVDFMEPTPKTITEEDKLPEGVTEEELKAEYSCLLYTSPSPRDRTRSRMPSSA